MDTYFAVTAPGLEALTAQELSSLGLQAGQSLDGGVLFQGERLSLYRANLYLRTASRVLVRFGEFFAVSFPELRRKAAQLPWERYLVPGQPIALRVTCRRSRLYHSDAVAERVAGAVADHLGRPSPYGKLAEEEGEQPEAPQRIVVRFQDDQCSISIDSSGALLHRRGYRQGTAKAPLRETLAAAMLLESGWDRVAPLLDPFCGSGTIAIEAALLALGLPPGRSRSFAFMNWPDYQPRLWGLLLATIQPVTTDFPLLIQASDRDAGAVRLAQENAERAGVSGHIEFTCRAVSAVEPPQGPGWMVTNPPYGVRVSGSHDLRNLYAQLGNVVRRRCPGWQVAILCNDLRLLGQTGLRLDTSLRFVNGGIPVRLGRGHVPG